MASVAEHLALCVDSIVTLPEELVRECFTKQEKAPPLSPETAAVPALPVPSPGTIVGAAVLKGTAPKPKPAAAVRSGTSTLSFRPSQPDNSELVYSSERNGTGPGCKDSAMGAAYDVGSAVAESWYNNTTQGALWELVAERPILPPPPEIDRVLLKDCASMIGEQKTDYQGIRKELRRAFWERLDQLA